MKTSHTDLLPKLPLGNLFKGHRGYLFTLRDAFVSLWCRVAPRLCAAERSPASPHAGIHLGTKAGRARLAPEAKHVILPALFRDRTSSRERRASLLFAYTWRCCVCRLDLFREGCIFEKEKAKALRWCCPSALCWYIGLPPLWYKLLKHCFFNMLLCFICCCRWLISLIGSMHYTLPAPVKASNNH